MENTIEYNCDQIIKLMEFIEENRTNHYAGCAKQLARKIKEINAKNNSTTNVQPYL